MNYWMKPWNKSLKALSHKPANKDAYKLSNDSKGTSTENSNRSPMARRRWLIGMMAATALLNSFPGTTFACGPFIEYATLAFDNNPDLPLKKFLGGELGIIRPTWAKSYLSVAYRYMVNKPLTKNQEAGVFDLWKNRLTSEGASDNSAGEDTWTTPRGKVPGVKPVKIDSWRKLASSDDSYDNFANCTHGSYENAATILAAKIAKHGASSPFVKDWVAAQDKVFCHCSTPEMKDGPGGKSNPEPPFPDVPKAGSDKEVLDDRKYQLAAALFYATQYDKAFADFKAISEDASSPYAKVSRYMMARCEVRKATTTKLDPKTIQSTFSQAATLVRAMLSDPSMSELHSACTSLLGFIEFRNDPASRLKELSAQVLSDNKATSAADYYRSLDDYTLLLLNMTGGPDDPYSTDPKKARPIPAAAKADDLSNWITIWESDDKTKFGYALDEWHKTHSEPWLLAALHLAPADKSKTDELLAAAKAVKPNAPAYLSIGYEACRVMHARGESSEAIKETMALKDLSMKKQLWSASNLLMDLRDKMPMDQPQFVDNSIRRVAAYSVFDEFMDDQFTPPAPGTKKNPNINVFGYDNARFANERMPLSVLAQICSDSKFPAKLKADAEQATWVRAVVLNDTATRDKVAPSLERDYPKLASLIKVTESGAEADRKFASVFLILKNPGLRPYITGGAARETALGELDEYTDNWWDSTTPDQDITYQENGNSTSKSKLKSTEFPGLLNADQAKAGAAEVKKLLATGSAPTFLCAAVSEYAAKHLSDPRVPEALFLAVRASKLGHKEDRATPFSKKCFQILHTNFPKSPFTKKTPYWY